MAGRWTGFSYQVTLVGKTYTTVAIYTIIIIIIADLISVLYVIVSAWLYMFCIYNNNTASTIIIIIIPTLCDQMSFYYYNKTVKQHGSST